MLSRAPSHPTTGLGKMASPSLYSLYSLPFRSLTFLSHTFAYLTTGLGKTAFPDLSYSALAYVLVSLHHLSCAAFRAGDLPGAVAAVDKALELELQSRPAG